MADTTRARQMLDKAVHFLTLAEQALEQANEDPAAVADIRQQAETVRDGLTETT